MSTGDSHDREDHLPSGPAVRPRRRVPSRSGRRRKLRIAALLCVVVVVGAGIAASSLRATDAERARHYRDLALMAMQQGDVEQARTRFHDSLRLEPGDLDTNLLLADLEFQEKNTDAAVVSYRNALTIETEHGFALAKLAEIEFAAGRLDTARDLAGRAIRSAQPTPAAFEIRGRIRVRQGDLAGAVEDFSELAALVPGEPLPCLRAGGIAAFLAATTFDERWEERADALLAEGALRAAALQDPDLRAEVLGMALLAQGRHAEAALEFSRLRPPRSDEAEVAALHAAALEGAGARDEAEYLLARTIQDTPDPVRLAALARLLINGGAASAAEAVLESGATLFPDDAGLALRRAARPLSTVRCADPTSFLGAGLQRPVRLTALDVPLHRAAALGTTPEARAAWLGVEGPIVVHAVAMEAADPQRVEQFETSVSAVWREDAPLAGLWRAALSLARGRVETARSQLDETLALRPDLPEALFVLGIARALAGDTDRARKDLHAACRSGAAPPARIAALASVLAASGEGEEARSVLREALAVRPGDPWLLGVAAGILGTDVESLGRQREPAAARYLRLARPSLSREDRVRLLEARIALGDDRPEDALGILDTVLLNAQGSREAARLRMRALLIVGRRMEDTARESPEEEAPILAAAHALEQAGDVDGALKLVEEGAELHHSPELGLVHARLLARAGQRDRALDRLGDLLTRNPRNEEALALRLRLGDRGSRETQDATDGLLRLLREAGPASRMRAARALVDAPETPPDLPRVLRAVCDETPREELPEPGREILRAYLDLAEGRFESALRRARTEAPDDDPLSGERHMVAALALERARHYPAAIAELELAGQAAGPPQQLGGQVARLRRKHGLRAYALGNARTAEEALLGSVTGGRFDFVPAMFLAEILGREDGPGPDGVVACHQALEAVAPRSVAGPMFLGYVLAGRGEHADAVGAFRTALSRAPTDPAALAAFVQAALRAGDPTAAVAACEQRLAAGPDPAGLSAYLLGNAHRARGDGDAAAAAYARALTSNPGHRTALRVLAATLVELGRGEEALRTVRDHLEIPPSAVAATATDMVWVLAAAADRRTAQRSLLAILERRRDPADDLLDDGLALRSAGDLDGAAAKFEEAVRTTPGRFPDASLLMHTLVAAGRADDARAIFAAEAAARPEDPIPPCILGILQETLGDVAAAAEHYKQVLRIEPRDPVALNNLAWLLAQQSGKTLAAIDLAERAVAAAPEFSNAADTLGFALARAGRHEEACAALRRACSLSPEYAPSWLYLARSLEALSRGTGALAAYERVAELDPALARAEGVAARIDEIRDAERR